MKTSPRFLSIGLVALALVGVAAAADETQSLKVGSLAYKAPATWKSEKPSNTMRAAQLKVAPVEGDTEPAELAITVLAGGGGGLEGNVKRWESQFIDGDKNTPKAKVETKKGLNVEVTRVEITGRYVASMPGQAKSDKPNSRLLGAIVMSKGTGYFFKMVGPDKTVTAATKGFDAMIESMSVEK